MSDIALPLSLELKLPWSANREQDKTFNKVLIKVSIPLLVFFLVIPWMPVLEKTYKDEGIKTAKTKLILDRGEVLEKPKTITETNPLPVPKSKQSMQATSQNKAKKTKSTSSVTVNKVGIAGFSKQLSALRGSLHVDTLTNKNVFTSKNGKVRRSTTAALGEKTALKSSGGINVDQMTVGNSGGALVAHQFLVVDSPIKGIDLPGGRQSEYNSSQERARDLESIRMVFEQHKGGVFSLYTKALRQHPELNGKFMFQLVIEADGSITDLRLIVSELGIAELEQRILAKISTIRFGAAAVAATAVQYKFVFLPY